MGMSSFMIPFGSTMGSTLNTFNSYGQQFLKNRLDQQQMQINQQRAQNEQQELRMKDAQMRWDMDREKYNVQQQQAGWGASAQMFSRFGSLLSDPKMRIGADAMANAAARGVPPEQIEKIASDFGLTENSKDLLNYYKDYWYYGRGKQAEATGTAIEGFTSGATGGPPAGAPTGYGAYGTPPPSPSSYGGGGGGPGGAPPNPFGAGTPPPPGGGAAGGGGGLPPGWSVVGTTDVRKHGSGWKVDPRDGRNYYIDPATGNVLAPGPMMAGGGPGMGGGGMGGGMAPPSPGSAFRPPPPNPLGTY